MVKLSEVKMKAEEPKQELQWSPMSLEQWVPLVEACPDDVWIIPKILPMDAVCLISGSAKVSMKTWLAFHLLLTITKGKGPIDVFTPVEKHNALIIELEKPAKQTAQRFRMLLSQFEDNTLPDNLYFSHRENILIDEPDWLNKIIKFIKEKNIKLVLIDTFVKSSRCEENSSKEINDTMRCIDTIRHAMDGGTVLFIHHLRKPSKDQLSDIDDDIRGSSALAGHYDVHFALRRKTLDQKHIDLTIRQSDAEEKYYKLRWFFDTAGSKVELNVETYDPDNINDELVDQCINRLYINTEYSNKDLRELWELNSTMVNAMRKELVDREVLRPIGKGKFLALGGMELPLLDEED
jgi:RecA-family ATPase